VAQLHFCDFVNDDQVRFPESLFQSGNDYALNRFCVHAILANFVWRLKSFSSQPRSLPVCRDNLEAHSFATLPHFFGEETTRFEVWWQQVQDFPNHCGFPDTG
jgi:hypothetical protein